MLEFLVTSKARRRLLVLMWAENARGSATELAERAGVSFASAHTELKAMQALQLVRGDRESGRETFAANSKHPDADLLRRLAKTTTRPHDETGDASLREKLVYLGAPLRGVKSRTIHQEDVVDVLVAGTDLARRDATVARSLPLCFWNQRDALDGNVLRELNASPEQKHAFALYLELAAELGGDRRLVGLAEGLRDYRISQVRPFAHGNRRTSARDFPLAAKWGFAMNADLESFRSLFDKFVAK